MAIANWPKPTPAMERYCHDYMQKPKQPYPRAPIRGSGNMTLQEPSLYEQEYVGMENENKPSSPSTTETDTSVVSKRKTITLNERARPNTSTTEKSQNPTRSLEVPDITEEEYLRRVAALQKLMNEYRLTPHKAYYTTTTSPYYD